MRHLKKIFGVTARTRILDVGGTPYNWSLLDVQPRLTLLNMPRAGGDLGACTTWVAGDGRALPFRDGAFDLVFSNSVIEHLGDYASQQRFAGEVARVGKAYYVQTPNRWFPVEHHLLTPLVHYLPKAWQAPIVRRCTVWSLLERPSPDRWRFYIEHYLRDVRLLSAGELARLFPGAAIVRERFLGITKALIAIGGR